MNPPMYAMNATPPADWGPCPVTSNALVMDERGDLFGLKHVQGGRIRPLSVLHNAD